MKRLLITLALLAALLALLVAPPLAAAATSLQPTVVMDWAPTPPDGQFAESMAADSHGALYVSNTVFGAWDEASQDYLPNIGEVWRIVPGMDPDLVWSDAITPYAMLTGVAIGRDDTVYVGVVDFSADYGLPEPAFGSGVLRLNGDDTMTRTVMLPMGTFPNGLALHHGALYISDSMLGAIWRAPLAGGLTEPAGPWIQSTLLAPGRNGLGANGIAFKADKLYVVVYDAGRIVKVPIRSDGGAGTPSTLCQRPELRTGDGIAFDTLGRLWVVTNGSKVTPDGGIWRVAGDGSVTKIVNDPGWLNYPVMPVFGRTCATATTLYVLNGAYWDFLDGSSPNLISLPVGVAGLPLR